MQKERLQLLKVNISFLDLAIHWRYNVQNYCHRSLVLDGHVWCISGWEYEAVSHHAPMHSDNTAFSIDSYGRCSIWSNVWQVAGNVEHIRGSGCCQWKYTWPWGCQSTESDEPSMHWSLDPLGGCAHLSDKLKLITMMRAEMGLMGMWRSEQYWREARWYRTWWNFLWWENTTCESNSALQQNTEGFYITVICQVYP